MEQSKLSVKFLIVLAFATIYLIWGTTYLVILVGLKGFPPFFMAALRFVLAGTILVGFSLYRKENWPSIRSVAKNSLLGIVILVGGQGILIWAEQYIGSGYAAVLVATLPIWYVLIDKKQWKICFSSPYIIIGIILGFIGILFLFKDYLVDSIPSKTSNDELIASLAVLLSSILWVSGSLYHRYRPAPGSIFSNLGWQLLAGAMFCVVLSFFIGELDSFTFLEVSWQSWLAVVYLALAGSIAAFVAYSWLLTQKPSAIVGTYAYVNPLVAVLLGWLLVDEVITFYQLLGMLIILISAILVNFSKYSLMKKRVNK